MKNKKIVILFTSIYTNSVSIALIKEIKKSTNNDFYLLGSLAFSEPPTFKYLNVYSKGPAYNNKIFLVSPNCETDETKDWREQSAYDATMAFTDGALEFPEDLTRRNMLNYLEKILGKLKNQEERSITNKKYYSCRY